VKRQIKVFSQRANDWTEVTATFVEDLIEAWISKETIENLKLDAIPGSPGDPKWGLLGRRSVPLEGTTELQWFPKDCKKVKDTTCRIVDSKLFGIYLQSHLLPPSPSSAERPGRVVSPSSSELNPDLHISPPRKFATVDNPLVLDEPLDTDTVTPKEEIVHESGTPSIGSFDGLPDTISETSKE
jgi:hypothetical protein